MRIRRRPLPFPPLISSSLLLSDPSTPTIQSIKDTSSVKIEDGVEQKGLHQDGDLQQTDPLRLEATSSKRDFRLLHPSPCQKFQSLEEEIKSVECKRVGTPTPSMDDSCTMGKEEKAKDKKKPKRGQAEAVLMAGSRCSRINGRGWRCSQPTLVGYSLCEHHLGKGRSRGPNIVPRGPLGCTEHGRKESGEGSVHEIMPKKKNKARSISSLLDERNEDHQLIGSGMKNGDSM
ncbi:hypothetical protein LUZ63_007217 [Rhynchospora breviuscula]|uniref:WRC domain-containing protein n=1 Tax=Rhynchospora breviuscula TaxID=2022672 RepID=A0A9Q0CRV1_9POAL|nr:hypothetical protein LUZ63_007217 [Rhynchospora breviuscula]